MTSQKKSTDDIFNAISDSLEERTGRDRRKNPDNGEYENSANDRRKGDRRNVNEDKDEA